MKSLSNFSIKNKNVLLRVDLNVPTIDGKVIEKSRIYLIKQTIHHLISNNNKIFLLSHYGRPNGKIDKKYSLKFLVDFLAKELVIDKITFIDCCYGEKVKLKKK